MARLVPFKIYPNKEPHQNSTNIGGVVYCILPETVISFEVSKQSVIKIIITVDGHYYNGNFYAGLDDVLIDLPEEIAETIIFNIDIFKNL